MPATVLAINVFANFVLTFYSIFCFKTKILVFNARKMASNTRRGDPDVVLEVEGVRFSCNRNVLASCSPYFRAMFSNSFAEKNKDVIKIQGVDASAMGVLLRWIDDATQLDSLQGEEVLVVLQAAAMLQLESLQRICEELIVQRWLSPSTCLFTAATADQLSLSKLHHKAFSMALWQFSEVRHSEAFLDLNVNYLIQYVAQDSLAVTEEFEVFEAVSSWIEHRVVERHSDTLTAISCVRMNDISVSDVRSMLNYTCVTNCSLTQQLIHCIINIKQGNETGYAGEDDICLEELTSARSSDDSGCCDTLRRLAGQMKSHAVSSGSSDLVVNDPVALGEKVDEDGDSKQRLGFQHETVQLAQGILSLSARQLPIAACTIGHILRPEKFNGAGNEMPNYTAAKKTKNEKNKSGTPYVFYWDAKNSVKPVPLVHLSKIDQGPVEAVGYNVLGKGEKIYVVGGEYLLGYGDWNKSVWRYNVKNETWSFETSLSVPRRHHSIVCLNDDMYVIGGCGRYRVIMDSVDRYNFISKTWYKCAPLPCSLYSAATCVHKGFIYVVTSQVFCYYPSTNTWVVLSEVTFPSGSSFNAAMSDGKYIYLTGLYSSELMRFNPDGDKVINSIGQFRNSAGNVCLVGNKIYSFTEHMDCPSVEVYDIAHGTFDVLWEDISNDCRISFKKLGGCFPLVLY